MEMTDGLHTELLLSARPAGARPVVERKAAMPVSPEANRAASSTLTVQMPNGITLQLECCSNDAALLLKN
jgi:hypothetical protein